MLVGRSREQQAIASLAAGARVGHSGVLVIVGEPGCGKSALLEEVAAWAPEPTGSPSGPARWAC